MTPKNDFEAEVIRFMARIDEHMDNQNKRCNSHSAQLGELDARTSSLEATRSYAKGVLKTIAVGVPALGSLTWFLFEVGKFIKGVK